MDLIVFENNGQKFALKSSVVREILDSLPVTPVPFAPDYVDGLISATGDVLLQINFSKRVNLFQSESLALQSFEPSSDSAYHEKGHTLVINCEKGLFTLKVEKVLSKITIDEKDINLIGGQRNGDEKTHHHNEIIGEISVNNSILLLLDELSLGLEDQFSTFVPIETDLTLGNQILTSYNNFSSKIINACLIVQIGSEYFAFRLEDALEIVKIKLDKEITKLPHAPQEIYGLYLLRNIALVSFSMSNLLKIEPETMDSFGIVVHTDLGRIILCVEKTHGIYNYSVSDMQPPANGDNQFLGWIAGPKNQMIGIIDTKVFLGKEILKKYETFIVSNDDTTPQQDLKKMQRYLSFWIGNEMCCLDLENVNQVSERNIETDLPHHLIDYAIEKKFNNLLCGVTQIQGIVMPIIDLYSVFHMKNFKDVRMSHNGQYVIVNCNGDVFALLVDRVDCVVNLNIDDIDNVINTSNAFVKGISKIGQQLAAILSLNPLQEYSEMMHLERER